MGLGVLAGEGEAREGGVARVDGSRDGTEEGVVVDDDVESCCACATLRGAGGGGPLFFGPPFVGAVASLFWASRTKLLIKSMLSLMTASSMPWDLRSPRKAIQEGSTPEDVKPFSAS
jgi:hypothetical protein